MNTNLQGVGLITVAVPLLIAVIQVVRSSCSARAREPTAGLAFAPSELFARSRSSLIVPPEGL